jgi:hypothetical protein
MKNMKAALATITAPMVLSFLSGVFGWYMEDGLYALIGFTMMGGIVWAWVIELKK